jgi:hypothetical protein
MIMIIAVDLGLAGPQAVSVVHRRDALHHREKKKAAHEDAAFMILFLLGFDFKFPRSGLVQLLLHRQDWWWLFQSCYR